MAAVNTPTTGVAAYLEEVYEQGKVHQLVPASVTVVKRAKFRDDMKHGEKSVFAIQLSHESGFSSGRGDVTLNASVAHVSANAEVEGYTLVLRSRISYDAMTRAATTKGAFIRWNDDRFIPMVESYQKRLEVLCIYGRASLGKVLTNTSGVIVLTPGTWAPGIWLGAEGTILEAFDALTGGAQHNADLTISAVDVDAQSVTVTGTNSAVVPDDLLFFKGFRGNEMYGLMAIALNTGLMFNINATNFGLWKANAYDAGTSGLTFGKVVAAAAKSANKGCDSRLICLVSNAAFANMNSDQAALRKYDAKYNSAKGENGFESLIFHSGNGEIEIVSSIFIKAGEALLYPERETYRIGSSDVTFMMPGEDKKIIFDVEASTAKEMRLYSDQQIFCSRPGWITRITRSDGLAL